MSTMITFAADNEFFRKRRRVHRACAACKKRRKKCSHTFDDQNAEAGSSSQSGHPATATSPSSAIPQYPEHRGSRGEQAHYGYLSKLGMPPRNENDPRAPTPPSFLGYLNPEAVLREPVYHDRGHQAGSPSAVTPVGQWIDGHEASPSDQPLPPQRPDETRPHMPTPQEAKVQRALAAYLDAVGVSIVPPREHQDALIDIYFEYVHPLLPIVDKNLFTGWYSRGEEPQMLLQSMCVVASKHATAADHLFLGDDTRKMAPRAFSQRLYRSVIAGIEAHLERNRVILIQVLALISLHCEGPDGAEQASMHLAQAIHHAHTHGLQFGHEWKNQKSDSQENLEDLFWCLWSLDKINACMNGRPLLMHDRDNSLTKPPTDPEKRFSPFGIWLQIAEMLDKVIDYYRPGRAPEETGWEEDFIGFEEMVGDGAEMLDGPAESFLSVFHHAMCMASHKSLSINDPIKSSPSYTRQALSASRVITLLKAEPPEMLPPLPIVPYALSLALSVAYRHFRSRRVKIHITRATDEIKECVALLNRLRSSWWVAGTVADLGTAVLNNANRSTKATTTQATAIGENGQKRRRSETARSEQQSHQQQPSQMQSQEQQGMMMGAQQWPAQQQHDSSIDPRLQPSQASACPATPSMAHLLNPSPLHSSAHPGQHPTSSERMDRNAPVNTVNASSETIASPPTLNAGSPSGNAFNPDAGAGPAAGTGFVDFNDASPGQWGTYDHCFDNLEGFLGASGADFSNELFRPMAGYEMDSFWGQDGILK